MMVVLGLLVDGSVTVVSYYCCPISQ